MIFSKDDLVHLPIVFQNTQYAQLRFCYLKGCGIVVSKKITANFHPSTIQQRKVLDKIKAEMESYNLGLNQLYINIPIVIYSDAEYHKIQIIQKFYSWDLGDICLQSRERGNSLGYYQISNIFLQLVKALRTLQDKNILHRDIKPENILVEIIDGVIKVKLADFGECKRCAIDQINHTGTKGTFHYMSPEIMSQESEGKIPYDNRSDLWSVGCIIYELLYQEYPFINKFTYNKFERIQTIREGELKLPNMQLTLLEEILKNVLTINYQQRITVKQAERQLENLMANRQTQPYLYLLSKEENAENDLTASDYFAIDEEQIAQPSPYLKEYQKVEQILIKFGVSSVEIRKMMQKIKISDQCCIKYPTESDIIFEVMKKTQSVTLFNHYDQHQGHEFNTQTKSNTSNSNAISQVQLNYSITEKIDTVFTFSHRKSQQENKQNIIGPQLIKKYSLPEKIIEKNIKKENVYLIKEFLKIFHEAVLNQMNKKMRLSTFLKKRCKQLDKNSNGRIQFDEFKEILKSLNIQILKEKYVKMIYSSYLPYDKKLLKDEDCSKNMSIQDLVRTMLTQSQYYKKKETSQNTKRHFL